MTVENWKKVKLLKLAELLQQETDEQNPLTTKEICDRMEGMGIPCDRRILSKDIAALNEAGMEILSIRINRKLAYYVDDRSFSVPELKILIDAVQAASFVTEKKTKELIDKIAALGGTHRAEILKHNMIRFNTRKHTNEQILYNVDALERALQEGNKIIFRYFDLGIHGEHVYRKNGDHYIGEPVALVYNEDNYYAVIYTAKYDGTANYRVDRMASVEVVADPVSPKALELRGTIGEYTEKAIKMYGGPLETVELEFTTDLIGAVFDRFGEETAMELTEDGMVRATVQVQISPTFWGWLFQFGEKMKIVSPDSVIEMYKGRVNDLSSK